MSVCPRPAERQRNVSDIRVIRWAKANHESAALSAYAKMYLDALRRYLRADVKYRELPWISARTYVLHETPAGGV